MDAIVYAIFEDRKEDLIQKETPTKEEEGEDFGIG